MEKKRDMNADLIRCIAVYSVISVHFLLNSKFYQQVVAGGDMYFLCIFRSCFMVCVPLFMILTGYLMWQKKLSRAYYKGVRKTLEIYILASIACLLFKKFWLGYHVTLLGGIFDIFDYDAANYSWYIEMYFGLFLMIPFLNNAYHGLEGKRQKQILVLSMISITMFPKLINMFNFTEPGWWLDPTISTEYQKFVPSFFTAMYPITYYFIGMYFREYGFPLEKERTLMLYFLCILVFGTYNFYRSYGQKFIWGANNTWGGENLITAAVLFGFLLQLHPDRWPKGIQKILTIVSNLALSTYLLSWISDQLVYPVFNQMVSEPLHRWHYYLIIAPLVFLMSNLMSAALHVVRGGTLKLAGNVDEFFRGKREK